MPSLPSIPDGVKLRGRDFSRITDAHNADRIVSIQGGTSFPGTNGTAIVIPRQKNARVITVRHVWFLTGQIESGPVLKIYVKPGMVNNFVPTIGGTLLVAVPAPGLTVTGASGLIQLKATVDGGGTITALIVENVAGPSVTADTLTLKYKLVGTWTASGGAFTSVTSILNTNQTLRLCVGNAEWY